MAAVEPRFLSCEDGLPPHLGLHNPFASFTAALMMAVPLSKVRRAFFSKDQRTATPLSLKLHTLCLLALFCGNLYSHARGIVDNQIFDRLPSWYGISGAFCLWGGNNDTALMYTLAFWCLIQTILMKNLEWSIENQVYQPVQGLTNLYIIFTMGRKSWSTRRLRNYFLSCLACFGAVQVVTALEPSVCQGPIFWVRLYHALIDHSVVGLLFHRVTGLMFELLVGTKSD